MRAYYLSYNQFILEAKFILSVFNVDTIYTPLLELTRPNIGDYLSPYPETHYLGFDRKNQVIYTIAQMGGRKSQYVRVLVYRYQASSYVFELDSYFVMVDVRFQKQIIIKKNGEPLVDYECELVSLRDTANQNIIIPNYHPASDPRYMIDVRPPSPDREGQEIDGLFNIYSQSIMVQMSCYVDGAYFDVRQPLSKVSRCRVEESQSGKSIYLCPIKLICIQLFWVDKNFDFVDKGIGQQIKIKQNMPAKSYLIYGISSAVISSFQKAIYAAQV